MGRLIVTQNMTLDGVIEQVGDWFSPAGQEADAEVQAELEAQTATEQALLLGRKTFEAFRAYWPAQTDDETGISAHLDRVQKYVFSSTLADPQWQNTTVLRGELTERTEALKAEVDGEIIVTGSITLVHALIRAGLVDEYRLFVYPVVVGRGRRLLEGATDPSKLRRIRCEAYRSGIVLATYRPTSP